MTEKITILAISGSLRSNSSNTTLVRAIAQLVPEFVDYSIYSLANIPLFDESDTPPASIVDFRQQLASADGILLCSPEYAYGISGVLKNALDWTVASGEFYDKPVAVITAAINGEKAHAALLNVLDAVAANVQEDATLIIPFVRSKLSKEGYITDNQVSISIETVLQSLIRQIQEESGVE